MSYLIDTNIISEIRKGPACDPSVARWWRGVAEDELYLSTLIVGEIRKGVERVRPRDPTKAAVLEAWLDDVIAGFDRRILPVDAAVADAWGRMAAIRPVPVVDALLAATAKVHGLTLATRNEADVDGLGADILNPFRVP